MVDRRAAWRWLLVRLELFADAAARGVGLGLGLAMVVWLAWMALRP